MGSKMLTGEMQRETLDALRDAQGITAADAMRSVGFDPDRMEESRWDPSRIAAYLELHIEQGQVLEMWQRRGVYIYPKNGPESF